MKFNLKLAGSRILGKSTMLLKQYSPEILTTVGIVGVVTAGVMAARATLKLEETIDRAQTRIDVAKSMKEDFDDYPEATHKKDMLRAYSQYTFDIVKLYGPSVTLGAASIGCIIGAHGIMRRRNVALLAAYKTLETAYSNYRARVIEEVGEEKERDLYLGLKEEEVVNEEGKKEVSKVVADPNGLSPYARFFDETNPNWVKNGELNLYYLRMHQNYWNDVLRTRGYVFLNEIYSDMEMDTSRAGQVVGWTISENGDNHIDFGIYDARNSDFVNGKERSIIVDFNVDGVIIDKMKDITIFDRRRK